MPEDYEANTDGQASWTNEGATPISRLRRYEKQGRVQPPKTGGYMARKNDVPGTGQGALFELEPEEGGLPPNLMERFVVPPFSVLDARQGYWQGRKRAWISLGIKSELGRGEALIGYSDQSRKGYDKHPDGTPKNKAEAEEYNASKALAEGAGLTSGTGNYEKLKKEREAFEANGGSLTYGDKVNERGLNHYRDLAKQEYRANTGPLLRGEMEQRQAAEGSAYPEGRVAAIRKARAEEAERKAYEEAMGKPYEANTNKGSSGAITAQHIGEAYGRKEMTGTSIFDPVLCEVAYRWFSPAGGRVLDPFAGGSVRGIVAAKLGRSYTGIDLSPYQVDANKMQAEEICGKDPYKPRWINGDSQHIPKLLDGDEPVDFVFTCPPYYDLEVYSKDKRDISNAGSYGDFYKAYRRIIWLACERLKQDRFAAIVIGDIRDGKTGMYRSFLQDTIEAFELAGLELYNNAVLVTVTGSLPVRVGKQFTAGRKLGRTHQYFLTFVKGDPKKATQAVGDCQAGIPEDW